MIIPAINPGTAAAMEETPTADVDITFCTWGEPGMDNAAVAIHPKIIPGAIYCGILDSLQSSKVKGAITNISTIALTPP